MSDLDRLAELYGVEPHYFDIWGKRHDISPATKLALLNALGLRTGSEGEIAASLRETLERSWRRPLPPAIVCTSGEPISVPLALRASLMDTPVRWQIRTEAGDRREGTVVPRELQAQDSIDLGGERFERRLAQLTALDETGYHEIEVSGGDAASAQLIVCPSRCYTMNDAVADERVWGLALQLYGIRSASNWGIGDFSDLARFATEAAAQGASVVGVNPLHALFPAEPQHFSPYSPSSREFLNPLYVDVEHATAADGCAPLRDFTSSSAFAERRDTARAAELVDYGTVSDLKMAALERSYACFREKELAASGGSGGAAFREFQQRRGESLRRHALFEALHEKFYRGEGIWSWREWPEAYRDSGSAEVARFAQTHQSRVEFFEYLQWQAEEQLAKAHRQALESGMPLGLYCDLAVAVHPDGETAWSWPDALVSEASVGAPPDDLGPEGQNWGLAPLNPVGLRETAYSVFISALRANMRHAGALRIDHVMGLQRLFWIPRGLRGSEGAYMRYPFQDLLGIIALESQRNRCVVIGEDLGTVPEGFREALQAVGILSYRVLFFERREDSSFRKPEEYPTEALVTASTHDLPTVAGFLASRDIDWRQKLGHYDDEEAAAGARAERGRSRELLDQALGAHAPNEAQMHAAPHLFLARAPSQILMVQAEDLLGEVEQPNLPGTHDEHPNWRRKLSMPLEEIFQRAETRSLLSEVARLRPRPKPS